MATASTPAEKFTALSGTQYTKAFDISGKETVCYVVKSVGSGITGTFQAQVSNNNVDWANLGASVAIPTAGGVTALNFEHVGSAFIRLAIAASAGTPAIESIGYAKG